ncbi:MAG: hypothetical protein PHD11_05175 [Bacteroidales bacterium]|nr:hypothetical protein [Bacteroidales bacterium]
MKKYLLFLFALITGLMTSSCIEKDLVTFHPGDLVAPVLENLPESQYVLEDGGTFSDFNYSLASVGMSASIQYELFAILQVDGATPKSVAKVTNKGAIAVNANTINNILIGLDCAADQEVSVGFYVKADWMSNSNKSLGISTQSNTIIAGITPFKAEKTYKSIYFRGGFNGWGASPQYRLYCFAEDDNTYTGTVDFDGDGKIADHISQGFKFADDAWGDINLGSDATEPDAAIISLVAGGANIMNYTTHRYYSFEVDVAGLKAYKTYGFDKMGVIGLNGNWDADIDMTWNPHYGRFYADVDATSDTEFKFRLDGGWDTNWGVGGVKGGGNIPISSGQYRIYFYFNNFEAPTYEINADMYGKDEPQGVEPEPEPEPKVENAWSLIGEIEGANWDKDFYLTESAGVWTSDVVNITGQFKLRFNNGWDENRGAKGDVEPFVVTPGVAFEVVAGGKNFGVPAAGYYKIVYDTATEKITVNSLSNQWSLIGEIGGTSWNKDFFMTEVETGVWQSETLKFANADGAEGSFKIRYNTSWDDANTRGASVADFVFEAGKEFDVVSPGNNIKAPSATTEYIVTFVPATNKVTINAALPQNAWSLIGGIDGSSWDKDFYMTQYATGIWVSAPVTINGEFKVRFNNDWSVNRGGDMVKTGAAFAVKHDGNNIKVPTADAKYQIIYNPALETVTVNPVADGWSVIGQFETFNWDNDLFLSDKGDGIFESEVFKGGAEIKLRFNGEWTTNRGGIFVKLGEAFAVKNDGDNIKLPVPGSFYKLVYNSKNETITVTSAWSLIGQVGTSSWDKDFCMTETSAGVWETTAVVNGEFKLRYHNEWDTPKGGGNRGGDLVTLGEPFAVTDGGANIKVPDTGVNYRVVYKVSAETVTVSKAE